MADDNTINGIRVPFVPARGVEGLRERPPVELPEARSFDRILDRELRELKFSRHAQERLEARNIQLNEQDLGKLQNAVAKAEAKGAQDSLLLLRDMAFIVSVRNHTVVTAMDGEKLKENVFTNIDSAVIVE
jgi:flagellar operon protein